MPRRSLHHAEDGHGWHRRPRPRGRRRQPPPSARHSPMRRRNQAPVRSILLHGGDRRRAWRRTGPWAPADPASEPFFALHPILSPSPPPSLPRPKPCCGTLRHLWLSFVPTRPRVVILASHCPHASMKSKRVVAPIAHAAEASFRGWGCQQEGCGSAGFQKGRVNEDRATMRSLASRRRSDRLRQNAHRIFAAMTGFAWEEVEDGLPLHEQEPRNPRGRWRRRTGGSRPPGPSHRSTRPLDVGD